MGTLLIMDTVDIDTQYYLNSHTYSKLISRKKMKKSLPPPSRLRPWASEKIVYSFWKFEYLPPKPNRIEISN